MIENIPGRAILLSREQAEKVQGRYRFHELDPKAVDDGRFIVGISALEEPDYALIIPFLATLPTCKLLRVDGVLSVKRHSEEAADPTVIERHYSPADKQNPLNNPPPPFVGDWSESRLYESVGRALSKWETFESEFANLFIAFLGPSVDSTPAQRAYGSVVSFEGRYQMVMAAAEAYFASTYQEPIKKRGQIIGRAFNEVARKAYTLSKHRNRIAHGVVGEYHTPEGHARGLALMPAYYSKHHRSLVEKPRGSTKPDYAYTTGEISFFGERFRELAAPTSRLWMLLYRYLEA